MYTRRQPEGIITIRIGRRAHLKGWNDNIDIRQCFAVGCIFDISTNGGIFLGTTYAT